MFRISSLVKMSKRPIGGGVPPVNNPALLTQPVSSFSYVQSSADRSALAGRA
jgi:hypothetical protein